MTEITLDPPRTVEIKALRWYWGLETVTFVSAIGAPTYRCVNCGKGVALTTVAAELHARDHFFRFVQAREQAREELTRGTGTIDPEIPTGDAEPSM